MLKSDDMPFFKIDGFSGLGEGKKWSKINNGEQGELPTPTLDLKKTAATIEKASGTLEPAW